MRLAPSVFLARIGPDGTIGFDFPRQQIAYCRSKFAGECVEVEVRLQASKRSNRQNRALWALIGEWAKERGHEPDDLKDVMLGIAFGHLEHVMPITGEIRQVLAKPHSSRLNVHEFCHLIEEVLRVAAEDGVFLLAPDEYRKAKEAAERKAAKEAA